MGETHPLEILFPDLPRYWNFPEKWAFFPDFPEIRPIRAGETGFSC
jgi:hypothetical protein